MSLHDQQRRLAPPVADLQLAADVLREIGRLGSALEKLAGNPAVMQQNADRLQGVATWLRAVVLSWHWGEPRAPREVPTLPALVAELGGMPHEILAATLGSLEGLLERQPIAAPAISLLALILTQARLEAVERSHG